MKYIIIILLSIQISFPLFSQKKEQRNEPQTGDNRQEAIFNTSVPAHVYDLILARPTATTITLSALSYHDASGYIEYSATSSQKPDTLNFVLRTNEPHEILLKNLKPSTRYNYRFFYKKGSDENFKKSAVYHFQTCRAKHESFIFNITADSHLDQNTDTAIYRQSLLNILADSSDFNIDLGDTYMTDKYRNNYKDAFNQYIAQRYYFGQLCHSTAFFFVQGNHDGETGQKLNGTAENMTVWSNLTRKKYFPNPLPNDFYSGNATSEPFLGLPQNYYSWEWGNALFVVLDPFLYTPRSGSDNPWDRTLGKTQYNWLKNTLEKSTAKFKFIFIHNLVGGADIKGKARGGSEAVPFYEWGGKNADGTVGFESHRPGWEMPIHALLVKNKVTAVFHGHDHLFARQETDGVVYQCLPQPGAKEYGKVRQAEEYGYLNGKILNAPGYMRFKVSGQKVVAEYVSTNIVNLSLNKKIEYSYEFNTK